MKRKLIVGIGGMGVSAVDRFAAEYRRVCSEQENDLRVETLVFDSAPIEYNECRNVNVCSVLESVSFDKSAVNMINSDALEELLSPNCDALFSPPDDYRPWRRWEFLRLVLALEANGSMALKQIEDVIGRLHAGYGIEDEYEICVVSSLAGSTGSALFLAVALLLKRILTENWGIMRVTVSAFLALPESFISDGPLESDSNAPFMMANAHAALKELWLMARTAYCRESVPLRLGHPQTRLGVLFDAQDPLYAVPDAFPFDCVLLVKKPYGVKPTAADACVAQTAELLLDHVYGPTRDLFASALENIRLMGGNAYSYLAEAESANARYPISHIKKGVLRYMAVSAVKQALQGGCDEGECEDLLGNYFACLYEKLDPVGAKIRENFAVYRMEQEYNTSLRANSLFDTNRKREQRAAAVYGQYEYCLESVKRCYRIFLAEIGQALSAAMMRMKTLLSYTRADGAGATAFFKADGRRRAPAETLALLQAMAERVRVCLAQRGPVWEDLEKQVEHPTDYDHLLTLSSPAVTGRSAYLALGADRFVKLSHMSESEATEYFFAPRTASQLDSQAILEDTAAILRRIDEEAVEQAKTLALQIALAKLEEAVGDCQTALNLLKKQLSYEEALGAKRLSGCYAPDSPRSVTLGAEEAHVSQILQSAEDAWRFASYEDIAKLSDAVAQGFCEWILTDTVKGDGLDIHASYESALSSVTEALASSEAMGTLFESQSAVDAVVPPHVKQRDELTAWVKNLLDKLVAKAASSPRDEAEQIEASVLFFDQSFAAFLLNNGLLELEAYSTEREDRRVDRAVETFLCGLSPSVQRCVRYEGRDGEWLRFSHFRFLQQAPTYFEKYRNAFAQVASLAKERDTLYLNPALFGNPSYYLD